MSQSITIDPVTRIEGHARVKLDLADDGSLSEAYLIVKEIRGFERILVGMEASRMPLITNRICGVCPSAHHIAASKALDSIAGVEPPPAGKLLRELLYMGHIIHSHALSLFVLHGPDILLPDTVPVSERNVVGLAKAAPEVAKKALRLRSLGQKINERVGGRGIHPVTSVAGGITFKLDGDSRRTLEKWADEALALAETLGELVEEKLAEKMRDAGTLAERWSTPALNLGTVKDGKLDFYEGMLACVDEHGKAVMQLDPAEYDKHLVEKCVSTTYMKSVFMRRGEQLLPYRVGPLARLNVAEAMATPRADAALKAFKRDHGPVCHSAALQIGARLVELIYACERAREIVAAPEITGDARVPATFRQGRGIGHVEAPRGTLIHDYTVNDEGIVQAANLIVATQQNSELINKTIKGSASAFVQQSDESKVLDAVEFAIRCYDPCLSCATHAVGQMPMLVEITTGGETVRTLRREA